MCVVTNNGKESKLSRTKPCLVLAMLLVGDVASGKTVGLWKVAPQYVSDAMIRTLEKGGWRVVTVGNADLDDGKVLADLDVLFLPGGWDAYRFVGFKARRNLVKFVAGGKGLLDGYVRTLNRPLFPQVGTATHYVNAQLISASGESELAEAIPEQFPLGEGSDLVVKAGPEGQLFAASGEEPVGVYGEVYRGRYVLFGGAFFRMEAEDKTAPAETTKRPVSMEVEDKAVLGGGPQQLLLACLDWLASAPTLAAEDQERHQARADLDFLRNEKLGDWTQNNNPGDGNLSVVPEIHSRLAGPLRKRLYTANLLKQSLTGESLDRCGALANDIQQAMDQLQHDYEKMLSEVGDRIREMEPAELTEDNPFLDAAGVLKRVKAAPGRTEVEKAGIIALVKRCSAEDPPLDAPQSVAMYLHECSISEKLMPAARLNQLTNGWDKTISAIRPAVQTPAPSAPATVPERLRNDPLFMPYYTGNISPTPQKVDYRDEFISMANVAVLVGTDVANPDPLVAVLADRITRYGGKAEVVPSPGDEHSAVVSLGDTEVARRARDIPAVPDKAQGYVLHATTVSDRPLFVLRGHDRLGLLWAISSLTQLIHWREGKALARAASVLDYPHLPKRGYLHGRSAGMFYPPARWGEMDLSKRPNTPKFLEKNRQFLLVCKFNEPIYQSLTIADCYHFNWKHPEKWPPEAQVPVMEMLGQSLRPLGITWYGGLSPHAAGASSPDELSRKLCGDAESIQGLLYFARKMEAAGGHLVIMLDDVRFPLHSYDQERFGTAREADTFIVTNVMAQLKREYPKARLLVCPPFYWGPGRYPGYAELCWQYLDAIGERWPAEVDVCWTGAQVNGIPLANKESVAWITRHIRRKPYFWQNCALTWLRPDWNHYGAEPIKTLRDLYWDGFLDAMSWYGFNSDMPQRCIVNAVVADFLWNPKAYDPETSVREAVGKLVGPDAYDLMHTFSYELAFFNAYGEKTSNWSSEEKMRQELAKHVDTAEEKLAAAEAALNELQERYPAEIAHWTSQPYYLGLHKGFVMNKIKRRDDLGIYRAVAAQRVRARKAGDFDPARDLFFGAADFSGGLLEEVVEDKTDVLADLMEETADGAEASDREPDGRPRVPGHILSAAATTGTAKFSLTAEQALQRFELACWVRQEGRTGRVVIRLNGTIVLDGKPSFAKETWGVLRAPIPVRLLQARPRVNVLTVETRVEGPPDDQVRLVIQYAVLRRLK